MESIILFLLFIAIGVTGMGAIIYLLLCYKLQKYMELNERDYWQSIGQPGLSFNNSIMKTKAFLHFY